MFDGQQLGETVVAQVKSYLEREVGSLKAENAELKARIAALEAVEMPEVVKGKDGENGTSVTIEDVAPMIASEVAKAVAALPTPKDGKDAANIVEALKHEGELVLTLEDGRLVRTGIRDGAKGEDGFDLTAFDVEKGEDGRTFVLKFEQGDTRHEYELTFPVPVYCGVFKEGDSYVPGDMVTWGGSLWHCDAETKEKPDTKCAAWTVACRKGRDGKDAKPNA